MQDYRPEDFEDESPEDYASKDESRFVNPEDEDYSDYYMEANEDRPQDFEDEIPDIYVNEDESRFGNPEDEDYRDDDINEMLDDNKKDSYDLINKADNNEDIDKPSLPEKINKDNTTSKISSIDKLKDTNQNNMYDKFYTKGQNIYNSRMVTYSANEQANNDIAFNEQRKYATLLTEGKDFLIDNINKNGLIRLWKYKDDFYFRFAQNSELYKGNKNYIGDIIRNFFSMNIRIVSQQDIAQNSTIKHNQIEDYIFTHQIPLIDKEVFKPSERDFFQKNGIWYKNKFVYTKFLEKRFREIQRPDIYDSLAIDFLENLVGELERDDKSKPRTKAILRWLSRCFLTMRGTHVALVLNGSKDIENLFWEKLIKPIFGNEEFCIIVNDDTLKMPLSDIIKEKVFLKIEDFTPTNENKQKIEELLKAVLVDKYLLTKSYPQQKIPVFAQVFITANETLAYMKKYHTLFEYIHILDENKIISNLAENTIDLEIKFNDEKEIDIFTDYLAVFDKNNSARLQIASHFIQKDEETLDNKIDAFIQAIKNQNKVYFNNVDDNDPIMYKELEFAFGKECFIGQDLAKYFNFVYGKEIFVSNSKFLILLKEKDKMFRQELTTIRVLNENKQEEILFQGIRTYKEVGNKKLYKITDYTLPEEIVVPRDKIIVNREGNQRLKYSYEDIDFAKKAYEEYDKADAN